MKSLIKSIIAIAIITVCAVSAFAEGSTYEAVKYINTIRPQASITTAQFLGKAVDRIGFNSGYFVFSVGSTYGTVTNWSITAVVQESSNDSTGFSTLTSGGVAATFSYTSSTTFYDTKYIINLSGLRSAKRYIRAAYTIGYNGTASSGVYIAGDFVLGKPDEEPVDND